MKMAPWIALSVLPVVVGVRQSLIREAAVRSGGQTVVKEKDVVAHRAESGIKASITSMVADMLRKDNKGDMKVRNIIHTATDKMGLDEAAEHIEGDLPPDVASLVRLTKSSGSAVAGKKDAPFDEDSIQKARRILNGMIQTAWLELDDVVFESKEFEERNRGTYEQVVNDLSRLGAQLSSLEEKRLAASAGIASYTQQRVEMDEQFEQALHDFEIIRNGNQIELTRRKNDLAVFDFILNMTRCKEGQKFVQLSAGSKASFVQRSNADKMQVCATEQGGLELHFDNIKLQHQIEKMMTPDARMALRAALGQVAKPLNLLQTSDADGNTTSQMVAVTVPVTEDPHPAGQWKKCVDGEENCGLLHDLMSLEWGKFRDEVDELTDVMTANQQAYDQQEANFNQQFTVIADAKTKFEEMLADAVSNINADTEEMNEKEEQKNELAMEFDKEMAIFRAQISEILYTKICAVRKVRNGICAHSSTSPPAQISDCDVSDWASKTGECFAPNGQVITCDDACPHESDPYQCGGEETMKRDVVVLPNEYGIVCPPLERQKRCGQKKCEVNCEMSVWSAWSACSKDCEGGVQVMTRSILIKPKNGGQQCDAVQEERPCHTGSCNRDCTLNDWTAWDFCSMSCGTGMTTRTRSVLVPIRGQGTCPLPSNAQRLEEEECNTHDCVGDEICVAKQDLIIAMDASGSLKQGGFEIVRNFTENLTSRYYAEYFATDAVKMGVVVFGNGYLVNQGGVTITSAAIALQPLTTDFATVRTKVKETTWQRGYTNMAQAFAAADTLLSQGGRETAQSAVLVITDGRYSMRYQTVEKARELKDKNVKVMMAAITNWEGSDIEPLHDIVSQPAATNFEHIPGLAALKANIPLYVDKMIAKFCPDSISPTAQVAHDVQYDYILVRESGVPTFDCGQLGWEVDEELNSVQECAEWAMESMNEMVFTYGKGEAEGRCMLYQLTVHKDVWTQYLNDRTEPHCPGVNSEPPGWENNPLFDTYFVNPDSMVI